MQRLHSTLDATRTARGLTWVELAREINKPFEGTTSIPIHPSTIRGMTTKRAVVGTVVLQVLRWLQRTPESFLTGRDAASTAEEALPEPGPGRVLRFDTRALYAALDARRREYGLTWKQLAAALPGFTESSLRNLSTGSATGFPPVMTLTQWLRRPAAQFVRDYSR